MVLMDKETVTKDILHWSETFVEVPHPSLGGWPPCPFARQARLNRTVEVLIGADPYFDLRNRARWGMGTQEVIVYAYDPAEWPYERFHTAIETANTEFLLRKDILALEDHPDSVEDVNGVIMNQGKYALVLVQSLSKLNIAAQQMGAKGFYHTWPEEYLTGLFNHRVDPR
jgi:TusA-related sulfurtransferase